MRTNVLAAIFTSAIALTATISFGQTLQFEKKSRSLDYGSSIPWSLLPTENSPLHDINSNVPLFHRLKVREASEDHTRTVEIERTQEFSDLENQIKKLRSELNLLGTLQAAEELGKSRRFVDRDEPTFSEDAELLRKANDVLGPFEVTRSTPVSYPQAGSISVPRSWSKENALYTEAQSLRSTIDNLIDQSDSRSVAIRFESSNDFNAGSEIVNAVPRLRANLSAIDIEALAKKTRTREQLLNLRRLLQKDSIQRQIDLGAFNFALQWLDQDLMVVTVMARREPKWNRYINELRRLKTNVELQITELNEQEKLSTTELLPLFFKTLSQNSLSKN